MPTQEIQTALDQETAERLAAELNRCFEALDAPADVFTTDVFCDLLPPYWRFQLLGPDALVAQLRAITEGDATARLLRVVPTPSGFAMEHEVTERGAKNEVARRLFLCEVRDGRISEVTCYCNGGWNEELRARHAAEAPMLRP
jgi:hypothetical protein